MMYVAPITWDLATISLVNGFPFLCGFIFVTGSGEALIICYFVVTDEIRVGYCTVGGTLFKLKYLCLQGN